MQPAIEGTHKRIIPQQGKEEGTETKLSLAGQGDRKGRKVKGFLQAFSTELEEEGGKKTRTAII